MIYHTNLPSIDISERKKWNCFRNCPMEKDTFKAIVITKFLTKFCLSIQNYFHPIDNFDDIYTNVVD